MIKEKKKRKTNGKTKPFKYTEEFVLKEALGMLEKINNDPSICYINTLFLDKDYSKQRYYEWIEKFKDNKQISDALGKINDIIEDRLIKGSIEKRYDGGFVKFILNAKFNYIPKSEIDNKLDGKLEITRGE